MQHMEIKYGLECPGFESRQGERFFSPLTRPNGLCGLPFLLSNVHRCSCWGVKRLGPESGHLIPSSDVVKNEWN